MMQSDDQQRVLLEDVTERDIDLLLMEEFVSSRSFVQLFTDKAGLAALDVVSVQHSKTDPEWGETDIEVILADGHTRIGLLIEDKIDARAMPDQAARYEERGNRSVTGGEYERFYVYMTAPQRYLVENDEAKKYPYSVSYEELLEYFRRMDSPAGRFKAAQVRQAISSQKKGYQVEEDPRVTEFWRKYAAYQKRFFFFLLLRYNGEKKGRFSSWPRFETAVRGLYIVHKTEAACVDLTFEGYGDRITELEKWRDRLLEADRDAYLVRRAGKSGVLRLEVPGTDVRLPFEDQLDRMIPCFTAVQKLSAFAKQLEQDGFVWPQP